MSYACWLRLSEVDAQGRRQIISKIIRMGKVAPADHPARLGHDVVCPPELVGLVHESDGSHVFLRDGLVARKPVVRILADRLRGRGNGRDQIVLQLQGVPTDWGPVLLEIGGMLVEYDDPEGLALSWQNPARVSVDIVDPFVEQEGKVVLSFVGEEDEL